MKPKRTIPTLVGIILLLFSTFVGVYLTGFSQTFFSRANTSCQPINLQVSNITHNSFNISFTTASQCSSSLSIDNRLIQNPKGSANSHYYFVHNLQAATDYSYSLVINGKTYDNLSATTAQSPNGEVPVSDLAWGRVLNADQTPAGGSIVFLTIPGASLLSAQVTQNGNWNVSLATSFNQSLTDWFTPPEGLEEDIIVVAPNGQTTQISSNTSHNDPVPDIILGQHSLDPATAQPSASLQLPEVTSSASFNLTIDNPGQNEVINSQKPQFFGQAPAGANVEITVNSSQPYQDQIESSTQGQWTWTPPKNLEPGPHTLTIRAQDPQTGLWRTITRQFVVQAAVDDALAFTSSPSATLIPPSPTAVSTSSPAPTSISSPTQAPTSTLAPTNTVVPTQRTSKPSTDSGVPVSGSPLPTATTILLSISLFLAGTYLLVFKN